jgi:hypothetical protein
MPARTRKANAAKSAIRGHVEHVFALPVGAHGNGRAHHQHRESEGNAHAGEHGPDLHNRERCGSKLSSEARRELRKAPCEKDRTELRYLIQIALLTENIILGLSVFQFTYATVY